MTDRFTRKAEAALGRPVLAAGGFIPAGGTATAFGGAFGVVGVLLARRREKQRTTLPRNLVLALTEDEAHAVHVKAFGAPVVVATWPLSGLDVTVEPKRLTYAVTLRLPAGEVHRLETPKGRGEPRENIAYRLQEASR